MPARSETTLELVVQTPDGEALHESVRGLRFPGADGHIGVLPRHAPMLAEVACGILRVRSPDGGLAAYAVGEGFADVAPAWTTLLVDFFNRPGDVDRDRAHAAMQRAAVRLRGRKEALDVARAEATATSTCLRIT
jgi:F-type H+-transporting ATPase subunit epsilon